MALINTARSTHLWRHLQVSRGCSSYLLHVYPSLWPQRWFVLMLLLLKTPSLTAEPVSPSFHHGTGTSGSSGVFLAPARLELLRYPTLWTELWIIPLHSSPSELRCLFWGQLRLLRFSLKDQGPGSQRFRADLAIFIWSSLKRLWWNAVSLLVLFFRTEADRSRWLQSCHLQDLLGEDELPMSSPIYTEIVVLCSVIFRSLLCSNYSFTH